MHDPQLMPYLWLVQRVLRGWFPMLEVAVVPAGNSVLLSTRRPFRHIWASTTPSRALVSLRFHRDAIWVDQPWSSADNGPIRLPWSEPDWEWQLVCTVERFLWAAVRRHGLDPVGLDLGGGE